METPNRDSSSLSEFRAKTQMDSKRLFVGCLPAVTTQGMAMHVFCLFLLEQRTFSAGTELQRDQKKVVFLLFGRCSPKKGPASVDIEIATITVGDNNRYSEGDTMTNTSWVRPVRRF